MIFAKSIHPFALAAAAVLAVVSLGATSDAAPVPPLPVDPASAVNLHDVGYTLGSIYGSVAPVSSSEGGLDGYWWVRDGEEPLYFADQKSLTDAILYHVSNVVAQAGTHVLPDDLTDGGADGVTDATGRD
ncbi:hypothetical protein BGX29_004132 [Mortierella sp. GBA35]|nr:hypothetical protein BGX29_004132 [Mortierella sp. GBA35]